MAAEQPAQQNNEYTLKEAAFVEYLSGIHSERLTQLDVDVASLEQELGEKRLIMTVLEKQPQHRKIVRRVGALHTEIAQIQNKLNRLLAQRRLTNSQALLFKEQYGAIRAVPRVIDAYVQPPSLVFVTDTLFGQDQDGNWRRVGRMRISFDLMNPQKVTFLWINLDGLVNAMHGPPNINHDAHRGGGVPGCMGEEADKVVAKARDARDYATIVRLMVRYPECAGAHNVITKWPLVNLTDVPQWYIETFGR